MKIFHDPEDLLSTIPTISTALLGIRAGSLLKNNTLNQNRKSAYIAFSGIIFLVIGQLWNLDFPINKTFGQALL